MPGATCRSPGVRRCEPEPEKVPIGIPLPDMTMDQFMDLEDSWSTREESVRVASQYEAVE
jgi:hypothetical protein